MESPKPTTPLCRRTLTAAHAATQMAAAYRRPHKSQDDASGDIGARRRRPERPARAPQRQEPGQGRGDQARLWSRPRPAEGASGGVSAPGGAARGGGQSDQAGKGADHSLPVIATGVEFAPSALSRHGRSSGRAPHDKAAPHHQAHLTMPTPRFSRRHEKTFLDPVPVRAMRRLQSRSPKRTGGR